MTSFWGDAGGFLDLDDDGELNDGESTSKASWEIGRDGLIFLIDVTKPMFENNNDTNETPFEICLKCLHNVLMSKIISSDKDLLGVVFYGSDQHKNSSEFKNVYYFQELDLPDAKRILQVEELQKPEKLENFEQEYGHNDTFAFSDALWACSNMFANSTYKLGQKRILIFTNSDDPHANDRELKKRALMKGKDLSDLGIELELLHMKRGDREFNVHKFYRDLIDDGDFASQVDATEKFDELLTRVRMKEFKKRATTRLPLMLSKDISLSVSVFALNRQATKGSYVKVDSRNNEEVKCVTKYICHDTGQELLPTDIKLYQEFGGAKVIYEKEEVAQMKDLVQPGFHLLGFKPKTFLKLYYHVKPCSFIYPDEGTIKVSSTLFTTLLNRCIAKEVLPICVVNTRASTPRFVALIPQSEEIDEHEMQIKPPGFHVCYLPYSDDIRKVKIESFAKADEQQIDKMKEIIDKLSFKYSVDMFENPAIQKFYRALEAYALDRDEVEEFKDLTLPNNEMFKKKAGGLMDEFKELVFPADYNPSATGSKRKATSSASSAPKKPKVDLVQLDISEVAKNGNLNKLTVAIMKTFCQANQIKASSQKKADLIQAIQNHFGV